MIRLMNTRLFSSDSPFRHGLRKGVSAHIKTKDFGTDVLIFASPKRLNKEAMSILSRTSDRDRQKAFWEVFAKRTNESVRFLDGETIGNILQSFERESNRRDLLSGICHFVAEDISQRPVLSEKFKSVDEIVNLMHYLNTYLMVVSDSTYQRIVEGLIDTAYTIETPEQVSQALDNLSRMKGNRKCDSEAERMLLRRLNSKQCESLGTIDGTFEQACAATMFNAI